MYRPTSTPWSTSRGPDPRGYKTGVVLNPRSTKSDDVNAATRMRTYEALIQTKQLGQGDKDEELWKSKGTICSM